MMKPGEDEIETITPQQQMETVKTTSPADEPSTKPTGPINVAAASARSVTINNNSTPSSQPSPPPPAPQTVVQTQPTRMVTTTTSPHPPAPASKNSFGRMQTKVRLIPDGRKGQLNTRYLATLPGVLKIAELILGFVAFILAICADRQSTSSAWTEHITFETTVVVSVFIILYVVFPHLSLADERTREGLVVVELLFYGLNALFFFIGIWLMVHLAASWTALGRGAAIMTAILCLALCVLYSVETFIKFKAWSGQDVVSRTNSPYTHRVPPAPTHGQGNGAGSEAEMKRFEPSATTTGGHNPENEDHVVV